MNMFNNFFSMPTPILIALIIAFYMVVTWIVYLLCTKFVPNERREDHSSMVAAVTQTVGTMYGLLLASVVVIILTNRSDVATSIQAEASSCANISILSMMLPKELDDKIHENLKNYLQAVKSVEWKSMAQQKINHEGRKYIISLQKNIFDYNSPSPNEGIIIQKIFDAMGNLVNARRDRIDSAQNKTHPYLWLILIAGSIIVITNCALFATRHKRFYFLVLSLVSVSIALIISLMVIFDRPFMGSLAIQPTAFDNALNVINDTRLLKEG